MNIFRLPIRPGSTGSRHYATPRLRRASHALNCFSLSRERGRGVLNQQKDQFRAAYDAGRQAYHEATAEDAAAKNL